MKAGIGTSCTADFIRIDGGADCPNQSQINTLSGAMIEGTFCGELFSWIAEDLAAMQTAGVCGKFIDGSPLDMLILVRGTFLKKN